VRGLGLEQVEGGWVAKTRNEALRADAEGAPARQGEGEGAREQPFAATGKQNPSERSERPEGGGSSALHGPPTEGGFGEPVDRRKGAAGDMAKAGPQMLHLGKSACPRQVDGGLE
jgi:hypothetical protein